MGEQISKQLLEFSSEAIHRGGGYIYGLSEDERRVAWTQRDSGIWLGVDAWLNKPVYRKKGVSVIGATIGVDINNQLGFSVLTYDHNEDDPLIDDPIGVFILDTFRHNFSSSSIPIFRPYRSNYSPPFETLNGQISSNKAAENC